MDKSTETQNTMSGKKNQIPRRVWSMQEEEALIVGLRELVARGMKSDNGFKTGHLTVLDSHMSRQFPGTDLKSYPHIHSKLTVWKMNYATLTTMLSRSGFGWNDKTMMIEVADDQVWDDFVKFDSNARTMRLKTWPYLKDWVIIFGKDRATGEGSEQVLEAVNELFANDKGKRHFSNSSPDVEIPSPTSFQSESGFVSGSRDDSASSPNKKLKFTKKQTTTLKETVTPIAEMMSHFFTKIDTKLGDLVTKVGFQHDLELMRQQVMDAVDVMPNLTEEDKMKVSMNICEKPQAVSMFLHVNAAKRNLMAKMILDGKNDFTK